MRKIQFNSIKYNLVTPENVRSSDFQATIFKENNTFDAIESDVKTSTKINIYEDDTLIGVYSGYTIFKAMATYPYDNNDVVSIELMNIDFQSQLNNINNDLINIHSIQNNHDAAIIDLGTGVSNLEDSQATQDLAIEDLAEAVSDLVEE